MFAVVVAAVVVFVVVVIVTHNEVIRRSQFLGKRKLICHPLSINNVSVL